MIARAKAAPGQVSFSSAGPGSQHHLLGEWMNIEAGTTMLHVPFKGAAPRVHRAARRAHRRADRDHYLRHPAW